MSQQEEPDREQATDDDAVKEHGQDDNAPREYGGRQGKDPTRYGDWEKNGRCIDF